jgi:CRISPR-associated protein Cas2
MQYVIAYDIQSDRRRTKVMNRLKDFGLRVQFSVFECELDARRLEMLKQDLLPLIDRKTDKLHIYRLCEACYLRSESFGRT